MPARLAILRSQVESALAGRIPAPFTYRDRKLVETVSAGIPEIDSLAGGLPRGCMTEIFGPTSSGRTTLLFSALASRTADAEVCALVDGRDAFDPHAAAAAGVNLDQLLWVRCHNLDHALRATDLLLQGKGFGMIAVDLSDIPPETVRRVPLNAWFRLRRAVEDTPTALLLLEQESNAKTCASLVLRLETGDARWFTAPTNHCDKDRTEKDRTEKDGRENFLWPSVAHPIARLLDGFAVCADLIRSRIQSIDGAPVTPIHSISAPPSASSPSGPAQNFATKTNWGYLGSPLIAP